MDLYTHFAGVSAHIIIKQVFKQDVLYLYYWLIGE